MQCAGRSLWIGGVVGCLFFALVACDDTRFVGMKTQVDTFLQSGGETVEQFTQDGTQQVDTFTQTGFHQVDSFSQKAAGKVDILWVVDNSASMFEEQTNLGVNFDDFIGFIDQSLIAYQIGVISTDMDQPTHRGRLLGTPKMITRGTPDPELAFKKNIAVGTTGGGNELGLTAAHEALGLPLIEDPNGNAGFLRDGASLAIIFVSDEDDKSKGEIAYYTRFFSKVKGIGNEKNVIVAAIVGDAPEGCATARFGERYHQLVDTLGGTKGSVCATDFSNTLKQIGLTVAGLTRKFQLSKPPDWSNVVVRVDAHDGHGAQPISKDDAAGWKPGWNDNAIYFDGAYVPPPNAVIEVEYGNVENQFRLTGRGDPTTLAVTVDAKDGKGPVRKEPEVDWIYSTDDNAIVFLEGRVPALDSEIEVYYSNLKRVFPLSHGVENVVTLTVEIKLESDASFRPVLRDDVNGWMYHPDTNSILFQGSFVPPFAAEVRVSYSNLRYLFPLSLPPRSASLDVRMDRDGAGPGMQEVVPRYDAETKTPGWVYYPPEKEPPFSNTISFEKIVWPPLGSVVTVTYVPGSGE